MRKPFPVCMIVLLIAPSGCDSPLDDSGKESVTADSPADERGRSGGAGSDRLPRIPDESSSLPVPARDAGMRDLRFPDPSQTNSSSSSEYMADGVGAPNGLAANGNTPIQSGNGQPGNGRPETMQPEAESIAAGGNNRKPTGGSHEAPLRSGLPLAATDQGSESPSLELKPGLKSEELMKLLIQADQDMHSITSGASGIRDPQKARDTLFQIIRMKQEAARRLAEDEAADPRFRTEGRRGQLQALSHLASLGQLDAAKQLREIAETNLQSDDPKLLSDSRLVLLGFHLEELQNGEEGAKQAVLRLVKDLALNASDSDVPAMMVMGRAREMLNQYGYFTEAKQVRDLINERFANSSDRHIAKLAAQVAGNVIYDGVNERLNQLIKGEVVPDQKWSESIERLIDESPDMQTVQYLAGSALDLESRDLLKPADTIYRVLESRFDAPDAATTREVEIAVEARERRRNAIGKSFPFNLPGLDGGGLSMQDYRGKIVLMPFWAANFTQSLQVVPMLKAFAEEHPENVSIVGMNLDLSATEAAVFAKKTDLGFPSFRATSSAEQSQRNPVAMLFGMVSMPFVVVFDPQGNVAEIDFSGRKLQSTVDRLIDEIAFD